MVHVLTPYIQETHVSTLFVINELYQVSAQEYIYHHNSTRRMNLCINHEKEVKVKIGL